MQPYFLPYIGYFQLINAADTFILYDKIKYTKKGWINRNRLLRNGKDAVFSLPLRKDSDALDVIDRTLSPTFDRDRLLDKIRGAYRRAPYFAQAIPLIERIIRYEDANLFRFVHQSIVKCCEHLGITTEIRVSSRIAIDLNLTNQNRVLALCSALGAEVYVNAIGGMDLYSHEAFKERGVELKFLRSKSFEYPQFGEKFMPWLSIVDVMMFNSLEAIQGRLGEFELS